MGFKNLSVVQMAKKEPKYSIDAHNIAFTLADGLDDYQDMISEIDPVEERLTFRFCFQRFYELKAQQLAKSKPQKMLDTRLKRAQIIKNFIGECNDMYADNFIEIAHE